MNNEQRAGRAKLAVAAYWGRDGEEELPTKVGDLVCDLLHLLDSEVVEPLFIPAPPPGFDSGFRRPHGGSAHPFVVLARGLNHYLAEIHPESLTDGDRGEDSVMDPLSDDVEEAIRVISEFLRGSDD